ncbi:TRAP transporter substrate-binding protein [Marivita sp. S6314]|uniref:TRAP transporter substrate-binding protein n=1 Tax=Marivita sp. S6314 TaxID=2926406 RepID=UPI001FF2B2DE|nr:TRAP transporter substrate-binding protein [Marivita sp. S6314]MCK0150839.1 TRAP transporter substrate-binding protein [Marivita sp. S6314]
MANEYPATSIHGQVADFLAQEVGRQTDGEIEITVHHGGALGYKTVEHFDAVGDGAIQLATSPFSQWLGIDPLFQISSLPFLAPTIDDARRLYDIAKPHYSKVLEDNGQVFLFATPWPPAGLWGNKSFGSAEDLVGVKIRTFDVTATELLKGVGAFPIKLAWSEVPAQLSTNAIQAVLTSANGGVGVQLWELQSHFTPVNYSTGLQATHINRDVWDGLTEAQRDQVLAAAVKAEAMGWDLASNSIAKDFEKMRANGMTINEDVPQEFRAFLNETAKPVVDAWAEKIGDRAVSILTPYRETN